MNDQSGRIAPRAAAAQTTATGAQTEVEHDDALQADTTTGVGRAS